jgi:hypothetical protein
MTKDESARLAELCAAISERLRKVCGSMPQDDRFSA